MQYWRARPTVRGLGWAVVLLVVLGLVTGYAVALWQAPDLLQVKGSPDPARDRHNARLLVVSAGGAIVVLVGLLFTWIGYRLSHRGQVTDRFTKALERLGSTDMDVRLGGIYSLAHVANDSLPHHNDVIEVLETFIRRRAPAARYDDGPTLAARPKLPDRPEADVQAALTALGRRPRRPEHRRIDLSGLHLTSARLGLLDLRDLVLHAADLREADLWGADLREANLEGADLREAHLWGADLRDANLEGADLREAHLWIADLRKAHLEHTDLSAANLEGAYLREANVWSADLRKAHLDGADLRKAHLWDADLREAHLEGADLREAHLWSADLREANLLRANLREAHLGGADLREAHLEGADLRGADLRHTYGMSPEEIRVVARVDHTTQFAVRPGPQPPDSATT
jgi:uncharacterized protein YjbI with pentapeptide repeats